MTTNNQTSIASLAKKRRTYSAEFKQQIVQACKAPDVSIASVALQHGLNTNLVSKWIRLIDAKPGNDRSPLPNKPAFIALSCSAPLDPTPTDMLTVQITLPHSKAEIGLKWQVSEISALAELLKALNMIRIDEIWLSTQPLDMRAGMDTVMAQIMKAFGYIKPHCAYLFCNKRGHRMKVLVHDGLGIWLCARRLEQGKFHWAKVHQGETVALSPEQLQALIQGLPWQRIGRQQVVTML
ncbi:IS66 family insertion sequence element accessory protein TnpB [Acinetobacter baumannii]|nr:IS66 family insertion sequence element accessory protein TnpB [Acinetobacter baumannii]MDV6991732.1 IS66 family insertion sequence element accessory protein TnpB [Acinetobacter baumannii]